MLQKKTARTADEQIISMVRGVVEVTVDEYGCQTVVATGYRYPASVDFGDGDVDDEGNFVPRYWGWSRPSGDIDDRFRGLVAVKPLNPPQSALVIPLPRTPQDWMEKNRERAELFKIGAGID